MPSDTEHLEFEALEGIRVMVWSGMVSRAEIFQTVRAEVDGIVVDWLRNAIDDEWEQKLAEEASWPEQTDCDRLGDAFAVLEQRGLMAWVSTDYTLTSALATLVAEFERLGGFDSDRTGHCILCGQDIQAALAGQGLYLSFGDVHDDDPATEELGRQICDELRRVGFAVEWNGRATQRIHIPEFEWRQRWVPEPIGQA